MELWAAAVLFIVCAVVAAAAGTRYRKSRKTGFVVLTVAASLLALALLAYSGLTLILIGGVMDMPAADTVCRGEAVLTSITRLEAFI